MLSALYAIAGNTSNDMLKQEISATNIAGSTIAGFKGRFVIDGNFKKKLESANTQLNKANEPSPKNVTVSDFTQGAIDSTGRLLDFAIEGNGFFQVKTPDGSTFFTRNGNFRISPKRFLTTSEGYKVIGKRGPIRVCSDDNLNNLRVSKDGIISIVQPNGSNKTLETLKIIEPENKNNLLRTTANYYILPKTEQTKTKNKYTIVNSALESSNVSAVEEMARMIDGLRSFEMNQKVLKTFVEIARQEQQKMA